MQFRHAFIVPALLFFTLACQVVTIPAQAKSLKPVKDVATENQVIQLYNQALKYSKEERNVHARVVLEKAATYDPTSVSAYIHAALSEIYHDLGNPDRAVQEAQTALRFDPSMKNLYYNLGLYCKDDNRYEEGIAYLTRFVESASGDQKVNALSLIESLRNEQSKMGSFTNNDPDYLGQLLAEGSAHSWAASRIPLRIYIQPTSSARGFLPGFPQIAHNAFVTWYQASGRKLAFTFVNNSADSDINVEWTDGTLKVGDEKYERTKAGLTTTTRKEAGIEHARIQIRTVRAFSKDPEPEDHIKETCLHEIGHSLGLNGHSSNTADIMYFGNTARQLPALTKRDKATMARLYQAYPPYPMDGVDSFPYPAPSTDQLSSEQTGATAGGGSQFRSFGNTGGNSGSPNTYSNGNGNPSSDQNQNEYGNSSGASSDSGATSQGDELLAMPEVEKGSSLPGIIYPAPGERTSSIPASSVTPRTSPYQQNNYRPPAYPQPPSFQQQSSYQQPSFQQQRPSYQQPGFQQQPVYPQPPAQAWQSAPAPYYPANTYPPTTPNTVPYGMPSTFAGQSPSGAYPGAIAPPRVTPYPQYGQSAGMPQTSGNVGPEQTPATNANPIMQFAQPIVQFAQQMFQPNQGATQSIPGGQVGAPGPNLQPMVNQVMKMFQPNQQPQPGP